MSDGGNKKKDRSRALAAGVLSAVGLLIVGAGAWLVLGFGAGTDAGSETGAGSSDARSTQVAPATAIEAALAAARSYRGSEEFAKAEAVLRAAVDEHVEDQALRLAYAEVLLDLQKTRSGVRAVRGGARDRAP